MMCVLVASLTRKVKAEQMRHVERFLEMLGALYLLFAATSTVVFVGALFYNLYLAYR